MAQPGSRTSSIELIGKDAAISDQDKAAIAAFAKSAAAGKSMTMVPQYSQLLDILGIMNSGVMSMMTIDQALAEGQSKAEAAVAACAGHHVHASRQRARRQLAGAPNPHD